MSHKEYRLQKSICTYLSLQFPRVLFLSDTIASVKLTIPQQVRNKAIQKKDFKCPDLLILEPKNGYAGLFIELKTSSPYKKNGDLYKNEHLEAQSETMEELTKKGYLCAFSWSYDMTKDLIDTYLN